MTAIARPARLAAFALVLLCIGSGAGGCGGGGGAPVDCTSEPTLCPRGTECDVQSRQCLPAGASSCTDSAECALPEKPVCSAGRCVACDALSVPEQADAACSARGEENSAACIRTGARKGRCGACRISAHCTDPARPFCDAASHSCRPCQKHAECPASQVCNLGGLLNAGSDGDGEVGRCVPPDKIVIVDADRCPRDPTADGSDERPFCEPQAALSRGALVVIRPRGSGIYAGVTVPAGQRAVLVGPGRESGPNPHIGPSSVSGDSASLVLSDLRVRGEPAGLSCSGGASLSVLRSLIQEGGQGLDATGCGRLVVAETEVRSSRGTGIRVGPGARSYRIVNTIVRDSGTTTAGSSGVFLAASASGSFAFNTLLGNGPSAMPADGGGVTCEAGGSPRALTDSILVQNGRSAGPTGTQIAGPCTLARVVVGVDAFPATPPSTAVLRILPDLDQSLRLLNTPNNRMYLVDKGQPDASLRVDHFGGERPKGMGPDLGAHELR